MTTRHWAVTDCDGKNERHPTLAQYLDEVERGKEQRNAFALVSSNASTASGGDPFSGLSLSSHSFRSKIGLKQSMTDRRRARRLGRCPRLLAHGDADAARLRGRSNKYQGSRFWGKLA